MSDNRLIQLTSRRKLDETDFAELADLLEAQKAGFLFDDELLGLYAESLADSRFITEPTPDCLACGACCAYFHQILIATEDSTPRSLAWEIVDADEQVTHWLRRKAGDAQCLAFTGRVGESARCEIYELRPTACRAFEAGSDRCHSLRRMYGLEPNLSADERNEHLQTMAADQQDDASDATVPEWGDDLKVQIGVLQELMAYNLDKLEAIGAEMKRLHALFGTRGATQAEQGCRMIIESTIGEQQMIAHEFASLTPELDNLSDVEQGELLLRLLSLGNASQIHKEEASRRLAEMGERAFEILGTKANVQNRFGLPTG